MTTGECCYVCNECPNSYATLPELEQHLSEGHIGLKTEIIEKMAVDEGIDQDHGVNSPSSSDSTSDDSVDMEEKPNVYHCRFCPKVFDDRSQLNVHYTHTHRDKPQYVCETCGVVFGVKRELSTHMRIHSGEQPHKCTQCGKEFGTRQLLKKHWMWHTGERSHVCPHCDKAFFQKGHLTQHLMIHAGGRPHRCQLCHKTFIFKFDLNRHMKIHAERGHLCSKCGRSFLKQASLEEHALKCKGSPALARSRSSTRTSTPLMTMTSDSAATPTSEPSVASPKTTTPIPPLVPQLNMLNFGTPTQAPSLPANINTEDFAKLAFFLQQQRALATLTAQNFANSQLLKGQTPFNGLATVLNGSNNHFCNFCQKTFPSQVTLQLHLNFQHMKNGVFVPHAVEEPTVTYAANGTSIFGHPLAGIKTEEPSHSHSESATNSSCASSPIKGSPMENHSPTNTVSDVDQFSGRSESPESEKPCDQCNVYARRNLELEAENSRLHKLCEEQKDLVRILSESLELHKASSLLFSARHEPLACSNI